MLIEVETAQQASRPRSETHRQQQQNNGDTTIAKSLLFKLHKFCLRSKPHIKAYKRLRKTHGEILTAMVQYLDEGKFTHTYDTTINVTSNKMTSSKMTSKKVNRNKATQQNEIFDFIYSLAQINYDLDTHIGEQAFLEMHFYKISINANSITDVFLQSNRYQDAEKVAMLQAMQVSVCGLFEITGVDDRSGYIMIREVFTGQAFKIIDVGLSSQHTAVDCYIYRRIITVGDISFGVGVALIFLKDDMFINQFIERHKTNYHPNAEFQRFNELYDQYTSDDGRVRTVTQGFK